MYDHHPGNDCVEVYYLGSISSAWNENMVACHNDGGVLISSRAAITTLAHELGHVLGLQDCYDAAVNGYGTPMLGRGECVLKERFASAQDWGRESGHGFYGKSDTVSSIVFTLLMSGIPNGAYGLGFDIPDGEVKASSVAAPHGSRMSLVLKPGRRAESPLWQLTGTDLIPICTGSFDQNVLINEFNQSDTHTHHGPVGSIAHRNPETGSRLPCTDNPLMFRRIRSPRPFPEVDLFCWEGLDGRGRSFLLSS